MLPIMAGNNRLRFFRTFSEGGSISTHWGVGRQGRSNRVQHADPQQIEFRPPPVHLAFNQLQSMNMTFYRPLRTLFHVGDDKPEIVSGVFVGGADDFGFDDDAA